MIRQNRHHGIDFLKFIATIMITNSHFIPLYKDHNINFATLGVHGNALFFFVSGFFLNNIKDRDGNTIGYFDWIRNKIIRLWPPMITFFVLANLIFFKKIGWYDFLFAGEYWFVRCFIISFSILYFIIRFKYKYLKHFFILSIIFTILVVCFTPKTNGSIYHSFHYICYFSSMVFGVYVGIKKNNIKLNSLTIDLTSCLLSFIFYFVLMFFGKGQVDMKYYLQLLALLPLISFLFFSYKFVSYDIFNSLSKTRLWSVVSLLSALTYEIYIVQFEVITDRFNEFYPFNTFIVFVLIVIAAYLLKVSTAFFVRLFSNDKFNLRDILSVV